ncbi:MAG TPA: helix-turn-helix domain-containing protein, partial [Thermoanaerobaculia bacterium]|nr:helix-turn-helix domain-containing protein [Thermoanaerobaculia bacterium]
MPKTLPPLALALRFLREALGWRANELADAVGVSASLITDYEGGRKTLGRERLEEIVASMGVPGQSIDDALAFLEKVTAQSRSRLYPLQPTAASEELRRIERIVKAAASATEQVVRPLVVHLSLELRAALDRQEVKVTWERVRRKQPAERRKLIRRSSEYRSWALCEAACAESLKVAPDSADQAVEYAELAIEISRLAAVEDLFRQRLQGYAEAHLGNARRVHGNLREADAIFGRARFLWQAGALGDPGLLDEARMLSLEASLRIDQHRPAEALKLVDQALAVDRNGLAKHLLIKRGRALEQLGEYDGAIAALRQAVPLFDGLQEPRLLFSVRFNLLNNLCHLRRFEEAQALLPEVRTQAERLGQELDLVRTLWLEGWVAAGLGGRKEAVASLEQVSREFIRLQIPSDAALASLELAVLYLEEGRAAEVRALALALAWIFDAEGVHPGTLAALRLFCQAAK